DTSTGNWINGAEMRPFSKNVFLGLACSRHSGPTPGCQSATAEFADFKIKPDAKFCFCSADSLGCPKAILLTFSHPVRAGALDRGNYVVSGGISVVSAQAGPKPNQIVLDVSTMAEATLYTARVVAGTVKDSAGDDLDQGCLSASFTHGLSYEAGSVHIVVNQAPFNWAPDYNGGLIGYVFQTRAYDTGLPVATDGQPAHQLNPSYFEDSGPTGVPDLDSIETYFARAIGLLQINADGDYRFSCSSDDGGALFLSTDEKPANKLQIAREPQWAGTREWTGNAPGEGGRSGDQGGGLFENVSAPIHLLAGHSYYLEFLHAE